MHFDLPREYVMGVVLWAQLLAILLWGGLRLRRHARTHGRWRRTANAVLSLWVALALVTALEVSFALTWDQTDSFNISNVSKQWFARHDREKRRLSLPGPSAINYRDDREFPLRVATGQRHICFLGDSFTYGHGIPDISARFTNRIRGDFESRAPGRFVVSNLSEPGRDVSWVAVQAAALVRSRADVHILVYVLCPNDIELFDDRSAAVIQELVDRSPRFFLWRDTYLLNFLYFRFAVATAPGARNYFSFLSDGYSSEPWNAMQRQLGALRDTCVRGGISLRIVIFPFLHNLGPGYPFELAHTRVAEFCRESGIPMLDLQRLFTLHQDEGLTVNPFDAHPNERAHALAAEAIGRELLADVFEGSPVN